MGFSGILIFNEDNSRNKILCMKLYFVSQTPVFLISKEIVARSSNKKKSNLGGVCQSQQNPLPIVIVMVSRMSIIIIAKVCCTVNEDERRYMP